MPSGNAVNTFLKSTIAPIMQESHKALGRRPGPAKSIRDVGFVPRGDYEPECFGMEEN